MIEVDECVRTKRKRERILNVSECAPQRGQSYIPPVRVEVGVVF